MAQIHEEVLVIKFSKLVKKSEGVDGVVNEDVISSIEQVAQELVGDACVVEVEKV